jgi:hypothetical protein
MPDRERPERTRQPSLAQVLFAPVDPMEIYKRAACPACTGAAVRLSWDDRLLWMIEYSDVPHCSETWSLAKQRLNHLLIYAAIRPGEICPPMPGDPQPEFWPNFAPPALPPGYDSHSPIERIKAAWRVEDLAERLGARLRGSGNELTSPCPLHNERKGQSFHVRVAEQRWKCWGQCQQSGDAYDLWKVARGRGVAVT